MRLADQNWLSHNTTTTLVDAFNIADVPLRFVGGCVRDALIGKPVKDVDAATTATPDRVVTLLNVAGIKSVPTGIEHGTVTAIVNGKPFEITTLRKDLSCDGRHAEVGFTEDWEEDARRRDFTMNAIYCAPDGELYDYHNGIEDAQAGIVRFIGDPQDRIQEDALRILRFFRFLATHGKHPADDSALNACRAHHDMIDLLSGERIQHEMAKLLQAPNPLPALEYMLPDILPHIISTASSVEPIEFLIGAEESLHIEPDAITRLAALIKKTLAPEDVIIHVRERWKMSNAAFKQLEQLVMHEPIALDALESTMKSTLRHLGQEQFIRMLALSWLPDAMNVFDVAKKLAFSWKAPEFPVSGEDLLSAGFAQGPELGATLKQLEALWESMDYEPDKLQLLLMAKNGLKPNQ